MATCFSLSLDHLQAKHAESKGTYVRWPEDGLNKDRNMLP